MNDSLDLRNRILKMRESNNLTVDKNVSKNNNLMSKFESSIKDDNQKKSISDKDIANDKNNDYVPKPIKNVFENPTQKDRSVNKNLKSNVNDNEAQFLILANKFNEAVEVILELSEKVERLERNIIQNSRKQKNNIKSSSFFNFKLFVFLLIIPIMVIGFFTLPFDFLLIKSIFIDILSTL